MISGQKRSSKHETSGDSGKGMRNVWKRRHDESPATHAYNSAKTANRIWPIHRDARRFCRFFLEKKILLVYFFPRPPTSHHEPFTHPSWSPYQTYSIPWWILSLHVDSDKTWCATAFQIIAYCCQCYNILYDWLLLWWNGLNPMKKGENHLDTGSRVLGPCQDLVHFSRNSGEELSWSERGIKRQ